MKRATQNQLTVLSRGDYRLFRDEGFHLLLVGPREKRFIKGHVERIHVLPPVGKLTNEIVREAVGEVPSGRTVWLIRRKNRALCTCTRQANPVAGMITPETETIAVVVRGITDAEEADKLRALVENRFRTWG